MWPMCLSFLNLRLMKSTGSAGLARVRTHVTIKLASKHDRLETRSDESFLVSRDFMEQLGRDEYTGATKAFNLSCRYGYLKMAQWLYGLPEAPTVGGVDVHVSNDDAFRSSCNNGHLAVAQWLYGLGGVDVCITSHNAFVGSCGNDHAIQLHPRGNQQESRVDGAAARGCACASARGMVGRRHRTEAHAHCHPTARGSMRRGVSSTGRREDSQGPLWHG